jgi:hypothetical protein
MNVWNSSKISGMIDEKIIYKLEYAYMQDAGRWDSPYGPRKTVTQTELRIFFSLSFWRKMNLSLQMTFICISF